MVVGEVAIDFTEKLHHFAAQSAKNRGGRRARNAIARVDHNFHRPCQLDVSHDSRHVSGLYAVLGDGSRCNAFTTMQAGYKLGRQVVVDHSVMQRLNFVAINRASGQHHFEAVVVLRIVAAGYLDTRCAKRAGSKVQHRRSHHADIQHIDTTGSQAAHERYRQRGAG